MQSKEGYNMGLNTEDVQNDIKEIEDKIKEMDKMTKIEKRKLSALQQYLGIKKKVKKSNKNQND